MHKKKMIAPIVITILTIIYLIVYGSIFLLFGEEMPAVIKVVGLIVLLFSIGVSIFVFVERIKEIRSGEEDDLSQY